MDCTNVSSGTDPRRAFKTPFGDVDKAVQFWGEARGESRKISAAQLKCASHSEPAESLAMAIWERMTPDHYRLVSEIEQILARSEQIRVFVLREKLGFILDALSVDIDELRAIHRVPIEALTLLLNHILKIYHLNKAELDTGEELVPLAERIKEQTSRAKEHGLSSVEVPQNIYASERAKLAMLQTQLLGQLKLKSGTGAKFQDEWRNLKFKLKDRYKKEKPREKLRQIVEIKDRLKEAQDNSKDSKMRGLKLENAKLMRCQSKLPSTTCLTSTQLLSPECVSVESTNDAGNVSSSNHTNEESINSSLDASIDTTAWVISPTHEYYFGSAPPVIPKTTVTHEVYAKPVETVIMEPVHCLKDQTGNALPIDEVIKVALEPSRSMVESGTSTKSLTTSASTIHDKEAANLEESQGDVSTLFTWTEPEKSVSDCLNLGEKSVEITAEELSRVVSDAAGDGCNLARTLEESNMDVLKPEAHEHELVSEDQPEIPPPRPFSLTGIVETDYTTSNESFGIPKGNLFSCNDTMFRARINQEDEVAQNDMQDAEDVNDAIELHDKPPVEPNDHITVNPISNQGKYIADETPNDSSKKQSLHVANKKVMDELNKALKNSSAKRGSDNFTTPSGSSTRTNEAQPGKFPYKKCNSNERSSIRRLNGALSNGDSVKKNVNEKPKLECPPNFTVPVPPPMPLFNSTDCPPKTVDEFQSATDFHATRILYLRPTSARQRQAKNTIRQKSNDDKEENKPEGYQETEDQSGRDANRGKRNDMVTLALLAFAVGIGTLGYMTMAATGANLLPEVLGAAGGSAVNVVEKALQILKSLNNRL